MRQESVAQLFRAQGLTSQAELMDAQAEQIRHPERKFQYDVALAAYKKLKTPEEISKLRAETEQATQAGRLSKARADEVIKLLDAKAEAERLGNIETVNRINENLTLLFPSVEIDPETGEVTEVRKPANIKAVELAKLLAQQEKSDLPERKFTTAQEQQAAQIEEDIRSEGVEGKGPESPAAISRYNDFNRYSNKNHVALNVNGKIEFFNLPKIGGRKITARQVYRAAQDANISVEEYVVQVLRMPEAAKALGVDLPKTELERRIGVEPLRRTEKP